VAHLALLKSGLLLSRSDALLDLAQVTNFYFDKTGTLEAVESTYIPVAQDMGADALLYLNDLAERSTHVTLRGLRTSGEKRLIQEITEHAGKGLVAKAVDGTEIIVPLSWRKWD
jgi:cation transport ATPase